MRPGGAPSRVVEILEADGGWMTFEQIHAEYTMRFGLCKIGTIRSACRRAATWGVPLEVRHVLAAMQREEYGKRSRLYGDTTVMQIEREVAEYRHCA
jgi:hypothetical protein